MEAGFFILLVSVATLLMGAAWAAAAFATDLSAHEQRRLRLIWRRRWQMLRDAGLDVMGWPLLVLSV